MPYSPLARFPERIDLSRSTLSSTIAVLSGTPPRMLSALNGRPVLSAVEVPVLGAVENMSGLECPHCGERIDVFTPAAESRSVWAEGVPLLGRIPLDPALGTLDGSTPAQGEAFDAVAVQVFDPLERRAAA